MIRTALATGLMALMLGTAAMTAAPAPAAAGSLTVTLSPKGEQAAKLQRKLKKLARLRNRPNTATVEQYGVGNAAAIGQSGSGNDAHVVRDEHHRGAMVACQAFQQRNDLRLDRHVERRGGLVGHDQLRLGGERERDDHALTHATGELVRILVDASLGRGNTRLLEQCNGACPRIGLADRQMRSDGLDQLTTDRVQRIQRRQRILEDRSDLASADAAHRFRRQVIDAAAFEPDLARGDSPRRFEQADDRRPGQRFAGA